MARHSHLVIEGCPDLPARLLAKLCQHQGLAQGVGAQVSVAVDPAAREVQLALLIRIGHPGVGPQMDGGKVDGLAGVVAQEVAPRAHAVIGVVHQQVCAQAGTQGPHSAHRGHHATRTCHATGQERHSFIRASK